MYEIRGHKLLLGKIFSDIECAVMNDIQYTPFGGWPNLRLKRDLIFDFAVSEMELRAPKKDRPIMQESYELKPYDSKLSQNNPNFWSEKLEVYFGKPFKIYTSDSKSSDSVIYNANWLIDDVQIALSVYGGIRESESGLSSASIYFDLKNEIDIAQPFVKANQDLENILWGNMIQPHEIKIYELRRTIQPYCYPDYLSRNPESIYETPIIVPKHKHG